MGLMILPGIGRALSRAFTALCLVLTMMVFPQPAVAQPARDSGIPLAAAEREAFLADLEQELSAVTTLLVRFRQERDLELFVEPVVSEGALAFARPDRLHWEWVTPYPSLLVLNRGRVERFDVDRGSLRRLRPAGEEMMRSVAMQMTRWLQGRFRESSELFDLEVYAGPPELIVLLPKGEGMAEMLARVELRLGSDPRVSSVTLVSPRGETTVMRYFEEMRGVELAHGLFDLDSPTLIGAKQPDADARAAD